MFSCVAVTRGGWGEVWGFESPDQAESHPLVQYGDAVVSSPEDTVECWNYLFLPRMCTEVLGDTAMDAQLRESIDSAPDHHTRDARVAVGGQEVWAVLQRSARTPPNDPAELVRKIADDRRLHNEWRDRETKRRTSMTQAAATTTTTAAAPKEKKIAGFATTAKISFGKDKDGKSYDTNDNNPKRAGTKSGDRFAKYKDGMTLEQAVAAGVTAADVKWDLGKGFIKVA